jgi:hypothetical protein
LEPPRPERLGKKQRAIPFAATRSAAAVAPHDALVAIPIASAGYLTLTKESREAALPGACITPIGATTIAWLLCAHSGSLAETAE